MRFLDTNIFLRLLIPDDPAKSAASLALFQRLRDGTEEATTCEAVIAEIVYVLSSKWTYGLSRPAIHSRLAPLLLLTGFKLPDRSVYLRALDLYVAHPSLDFEDTLCVAHMERAQLAEILSYDRDLDRVPTIKRIEPPTT